MSRLAPRFVAVVALALAGTTAGAQSPPPSAAEPVPNSPTVDLAAPHVLGLQIPSCADACVPDVDWKKIPRVRPFPRIGNWPVPPTGPGYYSALDQLRGDCLQGPPKYPYPRFGLIQPSFFDVDNFSYLDDPNNTEHDFFDPLKRVRLGDNWLFITGGDIRTRYEQHYNARLTETNNDYDLTRLRVYGDLWYRDDFRLYAEFLGAWSTPQNLPPLPIDQQRRRPPEPLRRREAGRPGRQPRLRPRRPAGVALRLAAAHLAARLGEHPADVPGRAGLPPDGEVGLRPVLGAAGHSQRRQVRLGGQQPELRGRVGDVPAEEGPGHRRLLPDAGQHQHA